MHNILNALDDEAPLGLVILDRHGAIAHMNRRMLQWCRIELDMVAGQSLLAIFPNADSAVLRGLLAGADGNRPAPHNERENPEKPEPSQRHLAVGNRQLHSLMCFPFGQDQGGPWHALLFYNSADTKTFNGAFALAARRLQSAQAIQRRLNRKLERANNHLLQSEKLAGIGQLAAGVAHEINNPIGYVFSNLKALAGYVQDMLKIIDAIEGAGNIDDLRQLKRTLEYDYIRGDVEALIGESEEGIDRVKKIITALKDFSHMDEEGFHKADLHRGIDTTLNVANNEIKYKAKVVKEYGQLPKVECNASQINQVIMNLLVNAAQSIIGFGTITIRTGHEGLWAWIEVEDTGAGMDAATMSRIFDLFFTTKPVGVGTGLGLSLSYSIVQKHQGRIEVSSEPGAGARFRVWLPITHTELIDSYEHKHNA